MDDKDIPQKPRMIVCAAMRNQSIVVIGIRHGDDLMMEQAKNGKGIAYWFTPVTESGFMDNRGNFLTRREAAEVAYESGQIKSLQDCLISEDLY